MPTYTAANVYAYAPVTGADQVAWVSLSDDNLPYPNIDTTAPVAAVNTPLAGSTLASKTTALVVDVTDASTLRRVIIFASFSDGTPAEMVYDGTAFTTKYSAGSARSSISNGYRYSVVRTDGWRSNPSLSIYALDESSLAYQTKNELNFTAFAWVFTADAVAPVIQNPSPAAASTLATSSTSVSVEVVDPSSGVAPASVVIAIANGGLYEVAYTGEAFASGYSGSRDTISGGYRYHVTRDAGWGADPTLTVQADDTEGNRLYLGASTVAWDFTPAPPDSAPTIDNVTPTPDGPLEPDDAIEFDILDDYGLRRAFIYARFPGLGTWEVIFDGTSWNPKYEEGSEFETDGGDTHFVLVRDGGWPEAPELEILPVDLAGNEP